MDLSWTLGIVVPVSLAAYWCYCKFCPGLVNSVHGKVVVVSGASSGLGKALTSAFYEAGARVVMLAPSFESLTEAKHEIENSCPNGGQLSVVRFDLTEPVTENYVKTLVEIYGKIDILVNNAGMSYRGTIADTGMDVHRKLMNVNYFGHVDLTTHLLPHLRETKGSIISISSIQGRIAIPFRSAYSASKHAYQAFMDTLRAEESANGVSVLVVSPGYIKTNLSLNALTSTGTNYGKMDETTSKGLSPEQMAELVIDAYKRGKNELTWKWEGVFLRTMWPDAYFWYMNRRAAKREGYA